MKIWIKTLWYLLTRKQCESCGLWVRHRKNFFNEALICETCFKDRVKVIRLNLEEIIREKRINAGQF